VPVAAYPELFNDVFGPVMQPGSSSHMAGPCRLGYLAGHLLGEPVARVVVQLDKDGSFAGTFGVMAEDRAIVAGVLGMLPDDPRLFRAFDVAEESGAKVAFEFTDLTESDHPNAVKFVLKGRSGLMAEFVGTSTGGGMVESVLVDGFPLRDIGDTYLLLVYDPSASLGGEALDLFLDELPEPVDARRVEVEGRGRMHVFKLAVEPDVEELRRALAGAAAGGRVVLLPPVLPVISQPDRKPQLFDTMTRWREVAAERSVGLWEVAVQYEMDASGWPRAWVIDRMKMLAGLMDRQTRAAYEGGVVVPTSPFKPDFTGPWAKHQASPRRVTGELTAQTIRWAYGAGAGIPGVETVPGPMGSGGGYVYAALSAVRDAHGLSDEDLLRGLFVAGGVGAIAFSRTEPTGEILGCTGEAGMCGAMSAAGIAEMVGGTPQQVEDAASLTLQAFTGMPCDPMPGGSCQPCRSRVIAATCMAHVFADLALAGHSAVLPLHEAIDVADAVGRALPPSLLCTSEGGACAAPTARTLREKFRRWFDETPPQERPPGSLI
jgi:L-serine dehydratase